MLTMFGRLAVLAALTMVAVPGIGMVLLAEEAAGTSAETDHDHDESDHDGSAADHDDPAHGHADEAETPPLLSFDIGSAICNLAIFLGVIAILSKFVWPVVLDALKAREDKIHKDLESAERANMEAKELLTEYQAKLDAASNQVQTILSDARKNAEASGRKIVEEARDEADRQRQQAITEIETAKKVALAELAGQTSDMAIHVAKQVVGRELKPEEHADLIRQALDRLPSNN
jgi:F-type H+-transporting ATPase subunit b